jgi:hypothetical protein
MPHRRCGYAKNMVDDSSAHLRQPVVLKMNYGMVARMRHAVSLAANQMHAKTLARKLRCGVANHGSKPNAT